MSTVRDLLRIKYDSKPAVIALMTAFCGFLLALAPLSTAISAFSLITITLLSALTPVSALVFLVIFAPMRALIATESGLDLPLDVGQILVAVFTGAWIIRRIADRQPLLKLQWSPVYTPIIIFISITGLTTFTAWSNGAWLTEWLKWNFAILLAILTMQISQGNRWQWIIFGLTVAGAANALVGLYIFFGGSGADHLVINNRFFRAFGTFGQPNPFGGFMGLIAPLSIGTTWGYFALTWQQWQTNRSIETFTLLTMFFYAAGSAVMSAALVTSWSRGAWLSFGAAVIIVGITLPRQWWQSVLLGMITVSLAASIWFAGLIPAPITDRINSATSELFAFNDVRAVDITGENFAVVERLAHWQAALNIAQDHPWLGVGLGNYEIAYDSYRLINWTEPLGHAHNYYLNILAEGGIIGFSAYVTLWLIIIRLTWRSRRHPDPVAHAVIAGLLGSWSYLLFHSFTDNLYVNNLFLHIGIMFGLLAAIEKQIENHVLTEGQYNEPECEHYGQRDRAPISYTPGWAN